MVSKSYRFLLFFTVVFGLHRVLPGWEARKWLLLASYVLTLLRDAPTVLVFDTELIDPQRQVLSLLGVPLHGYERRN